MTQTARRRKNKARSEEHRSNDNIKLIVITLLFFMTLFAFRSDSFLARMYLNELLSFDYQILIAFIVSIVLGIVLSTQNNIIIAISTVLFIMSNISMSFLPVSLHGSQDWLFAIFLTLAFMKSIVHSIEA